MAGYKKFTGRVISAQATVWVELEDGTKVALHDDLNNLVDKEVEVFAGHCDPVKGLLGFGGWNYREGSSWLDSLVNRALSAMKGVH